MHDELLNELLQIRKKHDDGEKDPSSTEIGSLLEKYKKCVFRHIATKVTIRYLDYETRQTTANKGTVLVLDNRSISEEKMKQLRDRVLLCTIWSYCNYLMLNVLADDAKLSRGQDPLIIEKTISMQVKQTMDRISEVTEFVKEETDEVGLITSMAIAMVELRRYLQLNEFQIISIIEILLDPGSYHGRKDSAAKLAEKTISKICI